MSIISVWLNGFDPYGTQRLFFYKCLYIATLVMFVNVVYKPIIFSAYFWPSLLMILTYESAQIISTKDKLMHFIIVYTTCIIVAVTFYLFYPYKVWFTIYATLCYFVYFYLSAKYWRKISHSIFGIFFISSGIMIVKPELSLQVTSNIFFAILLSMVVVITGIRTFPNYNLYVWRRAFALFIHEIITEIDFVLNDNYANFSYRLSVTHLNIMRSVRHQLPKKYILFTTRTAINLRDMHMTLGYVAHNQIDRLFLQDLKNRLEIFYQAVYSFEICTINSLPICQTNYSYSLIDTYLAKSMSSWNKLCLKK